MGKSRLMILGLGLVVMMGIAAAAATVHVASAHPQSSHVTNAVGNDLSIQAPAAQTPEATEPADKAGDAANDPDANAPCATDPKTGEQTGNCEDAPGSSGHEDTGAAAQGPDTGQSGQ